MNYILLPKRLSPLEFQKEKHNIISSTFSALTAHTLQLHGEAILLFNFKLLFSISNLTRTHMDFIPISIRVPVSSPLEVRPCYTVWINLGIFLTQTAFANHSYLFGAPNDSMRANCNHWTRSRVQSFD
ncbi:hypothetical protein C1H46_001777 [Malus baccata]|uniref:Uncharacterized protein n=1 Tax=Malus baccata TaxID=106549 RepID=A0A540NNH2_MALBA|nr:hypothetical protein C1H46_001777 [Malus baccata]